MVQQQYRATAEGLCGVGVGPACGREGVERGDDERVCERESLEIMRQQKKGNRQSLFFNNDRKIIVTSRNPSELQLNANCCWKISAHGIHHHPWIA